MVIECEGAGLRWLREWTSQSGKRSAAISQVGGLSGTAEPHPERGVCAAIAGTMMSWPQTGGSDPPVVARRATRGWVHKSWGKRASLLVGAWGRRGHGACLWLTRTICIFAGHIDGGKQTQAFWEWDASWWRLGEATPQQGSIGGVGGDTVFPRHPPPAVIMATANREGKKLCV